MLCTCNSIRAHETTALDIMIHPEDQDAIYENEVALTVSASGPDTLSYQWMKDRDSIISDDYIGVDTHILQITSFSPEHDGQYVCIVSNEYCSLTSKPGHLKGTGTY